MKPSLRYAEHFIDFEWFAAQVAIAALMHQLRHVCADEGVNIFFYLQGAL